MRYSLTLSGYHRISITSTAALRFYGFSYSTDDSSFFGSIQYPLTSLPGRIRLRQCTVYVHENQTHMHDRTCANTLFSTERRRRASARRRERVNAPKHAESARAHARRGDAPPSANLREGEAARPRLPPEGGASPRCRPPRAAPAAGRALPLGLTHHRWG